MGGTHLHLSARSGRSPENLFLCLQTEDALENTVSVMNSVVQTVYLWEWNGTGLKGRKAG